MKHSAVHLRAAGWLLPGLLSLLVGCEEGPPPPELLCHAGAYQLASGERLALTPSDADTLRYRFFDGRSGRLYPDGDGRFVSGPGWASREPVVVVAQLDDCAAGRLRWAQAGGAPAEGSRIRLRETRQRFRGRDVELEGKLVLPPGEPRAIVVLGHGSESFAATDFYAWQYLMPPEGIGVFVFDKRGTGRSGGSYTQDFDVLADDLAAAVREARGLTGTVVPIGLLGGSQGGWVAPLAAVREPVDFVVIAYGIVESPLAEDREEVLSGLRRAGYGPQVLERARAVTDATGAVMASGFKGGYEALAEVKRRYGDEPWMARLEGEFTQDLISYPGWVLRVVGPWFDQGTPWDYDPLPALDTLLARDTPILWILGGEDTEAPPGETLDILRERQSGPGRLDIAVFPKAEHGIIEVDTTGGERRLLGHSAGYWALQARWVLARDLRGEFGRAELWPDPANVPAPAPSEGGA